MNARERLLLRDWIAEPAFRLESERLALVPLEAAHAHAYHCMFTPHITRYQYPDPFADEAAAEAYVRRAVQSRRAGKDLILAVLDRESEIFLGSIELHAGDSAFPEIGVWIAETYWHRGYGLEAVETLLAHFRACPEVRAFLYETDYRNYASVRLAHKLGGLYQGCSRVNGAGGKELRLNAYLIP